MAMAIAFDSFFGIELWSAKKLTSNVSYIRISTARKEGGLTSSTLMALRTQPRVFVSVSAIQRRIYGSKS